MIERLGKRHIFADNFYLFKVWVSVDVGGCRGQTGPLTFVDTDTGHTIYSLQHPLVGDR